MWIVVWVDCTDRREENCALLFKQHAVFFLSVEYAESQSLAFRNFLFCQSSRMVGIIRGSILRDFHSVWVEPNVKLVLFFVIKKMCIGICWLCFLSVVYSLFRKWTEQCNSCFLATFSSAVVVVPFLYFTTFILK